MESPLPLTLHTQQTPADVAVVIPTILRPSLLRAVRSVFQQEFEGRIHLLIGIDIPLGDPGLVDQLRAECPDHVMMTVLDLGYSTSRRHGGLHPNAYSGALRAILSLAANSRFVAYLDDNDWYAPIHLALLRQTIEGRQWAFSYRWLIDPHTQWPICIDEWDAVGPDAGINREMFGGFVHPSTLMIDKMACQAVLTLWGEALTPDGEGEDRLIFQALRNNFTWACSDHPTSFCTLNAQSIADDHHVQEFQARGVHWLGQAEQIDRIAYLLRTGETALANHDPQTALTAANQVLALHPYQPDALELCGKSRNSLNLDGALQIAQARLLQSGLQAFD